MAFKTCIRRGVHISKYSSSFPAVRGLSTDTISLPEISFEHPVYKGPDYSWIKDARKNNLTPALMTFYKSPILIHSGRMQWLFDNNNKRYLDLFGGIVTVSLGHCHPKINQAAIEQIGKLWHTTNIYYHPKIHEYAAKLSDKLPEHLNVTYFVNSGSEANDLAMMMARLYTGAHDLVSLRNSYHGASPSAISLSGHSNWKYQIANASGVHHASNPDCYRGIWGGHRDSPVQSMRANESKLENGICSSADKYVDQLREVLQYSVSENRPAAFFAEPIQGVGGTVQYPLGYLKKAYELIRENGGLCVADEVQTGFGRTGDHFWGFESHGVVPDIVTMAKGIGNGFPLAAVVTTKEIAQTMSGALHFNTYGGNPMSCAVGMAVLETIEEEKTQEKCKVLGTYFLIELEKLRTDFEIVGDVRGKGLMIGIEMVNDKESRTPLQAEKMSDIFEDCKDMGILLGRGGRFSNVFRIKPPMCITKEDVDFSIKVMRRALEKNT